MVEDNRKQLILRLHPELHKLLKRYALEKGKPMNDIVVEWIEEQLKKPTEDDVL